MATTCAACLLSLPVEAFSIDRGRKSGLNPYCRGCKGAISKAHYGANRDRYKVVRAEWWKRSAETLKVRRQEYGNTHSIERGAASRQWATDNPEKVKATARASQVKLRALYPERMAAYAAKNYRKHRDARLIANHAGRSGGGDLTSEQWLWLLEQCGHKCQSCGTQESSLLPFYWNRLVRLEADHVIPVIKGGQTTLSNIQPLCQSCNNSKRAKSTDYRSEELKTAISKYITSTL